MTSKRLAEIREREQAEAGLGTGNREGRLSQVPRPGALEDTTEFRGHLVHAIRKFRPDVILTTDPHRRSFYLHRDHRMCGMVTMDAVYPYARDRLHFLSTSPRRAGDLQGRRRAVLGSEEPDTFIDISDTIDLKITSLKKHASQVSSDGDRDVGEFVRANARRVGQRADIPYAEAFRRVSIRR